MAHSFEHIPVLRDEVVSLFASVPPGVVVDATVGGGGHAAALLEAYPALRIVGLDRDPAALEAARSGCPPSGTGSRSCGRPFSSLSELVSDLGLGPLSGVLFDLGVSSPQLDRCERGFSFRADGPLDMRMDPSTGVDGGRPGQQAARGGSGRAVPGERRGATVRAYRPRGREGPATHLDEAAGRRRGVGGARGGPPQGPPGPSGLPGPADRGERRAGAARRCAAGRPVAPGRRRRVRRDQLPLGRGPAHQADLRRGRLRRLRLSAGPALRLRCRGPAPARLPRCPQAVAGGDRRQPPRRERPAPCHRADGGGADGTAG